MSFEDKLKAFMSDSESRQADVRHATDRKNGSRRRNKEENRGKPRFCFYMPVHRSVGRAFRHRLTGVHELR